MAIASSSECSLPLAMRSFTASRPWCLAFSTVPFSTFSFSGAESRLAAARINASIRPPRFPDREPTDEDSASFTARGSTGRAGQKKPSTPEIRLADVRARKKLFRRTGEHDAAALEHVTAACHRERHARVLLDDEHGCPEGAVDLADALEHREHEARGEAERRLVEEEEPWPAHQSPSDREHLLLAARELPAEDAPEPAQIGKQIEDLLQILDARPRRGSEAQVLLDRQTGKNAAPFRHVGDAQADEGLRLRAMDRRAGKGDRASLGPHQAGDGAQRGRLAGSIRAEERDDLSFAHFERHAAKRADAAVRGVDIFEDEEGLLPGGRPTLRPVCAGSQRGPPRPPDLPNLPPV